MNQQTYLSYLSTGVKEYLCNPTSSFWKELLSYITPDIPHDAHLKSTEMTRFLLDIGFYSTNRSEKSYKRILGKSSFNKSDAAFKALSDLIGHRLKVQSPSEITKIIEIIKSAVESVGGCCHLRNSITGDDGNITDIVAYMFVYLPSIGHIAELQIGHPFAAYTFEMDSLIRDQKFGHNIFDFWSIPSDRKNCFYIEVKNKILKGDISGVETLWSTYYPNIDYPETLRHMFK